MFDSWFPLDTFLHGPIGRYIPIPKLLRAYVCYKLDKECGWEAFEDFRNGK